MLHKVLCDNQGHIIHIIGPFSLLKFDGHIWQESLDDVNLWNGMDDENPEHSNRFEVFIGDNHYMTALQFATPVNKPHREKLDPLELQYNNYCGSVRSTIEQVFGYLKTGAIIGGVYRGMLGRETGYNFLSTAIQFCSELYNARFTILGHKKRDIRVFARDAQGVPLCPPPNLTPENIRTRLNLHNQLSRFNVVSETKYYYACDVNSRKDSMSFRTGDHVWVFDEEQQDFIKANITGCVNGLFSIRSADKKLIRACVTPPIIFPRIKNSGDKPIVSHFIIPSQLFASATSNANPITNENVPAYKQHENVNEITNASSHASQPMSPILQSPPAVHAPINADFDVGAHNCDYSSDDEIEFLDDEFLFEMGIDVVDQQEDESAEELDKTSYSERSIYMEQDTEAHSTDTNSEMIPDDSNDSPSERPPNPWDVFSNADNDTIICSSYLDKEQITKKDAARLLNKGWISDQIINFFCTSVSRHNFTNPLQHNTRKCYLSNVWLLYKISSMSIYGEIGRYDYNSVRRFFRAQDVKPWELDTICLPLNIQKCHWLCCIIKVPEMEILVIDSKPEFAAHVSRKQIGECTKKWYRDEIKSGKKLIAEKDGPLFIQNPVLREETVRDINVKLHNIPSWQVIPLTLWHQGEDNDWDCGVLKMLAMFYFASAQRHQMQTPAITESQVNQTRSILLNFLGYKYKTNSNEEFDQNLLFDLIL
jgi:hypothetical protein